MTAVALLSRIERLETIRKLRGRPSASAERKERAFSRLLEILSHALPSDPYHPEQTLHTLKSTTEKVSELATRCSTGELTADDTAILESLLADDLTIVAMSAIRVVQLLAEVEASV